MTDLTTLNEMAKAARCIDDDDWGSDRQIEAFNAFNIAASDLMTDEEQNAWDRFSMKASSDEIVDEALRIVTKHFGGTES